MENSIDTNLDLFNPKKAELQELAAKFKDLKINGIDDKTGYKLVHEAQMTLRGFRTNIQKTRLAYTKQFDEAKAKAMGLEKELLAIITPIEDSLKEQKEAVDAEKDRIKIEEEEKKRKFIQDRADILKQYEYFDFDFYALGMMSEEGFKELVEAKKLEFKEKQIRLFSGEITSCKTLIEIQTLIQKVPEEIFETIKTLYIDKCLELQTQQDEKEKNEMIIKIFNAKTINDLENIIEEIVAIYGNECELFEKELESKKKTLESEEKLKQAQKIIDEQNAKIAKEKDDKNNFRKQQMMKVFGKIIEEYLEIDDIDFMEKIQEQEKINADLEAEKIQKAKEEGERKAKEKADEIKKNTDDEIENLSKIDDYEILRQKRIVFSTSISYEKERLISYIEKRMNEIEEKQNQEKLEKEKKYQDFLKANEGKFDKIVKEDGKIVLYKNIAEFII